MALEFKKHDLEWTRELSSRFWNCQSRSDTDYFSQQVGLGIVRAASRAGVPLRGKVLDYGCGRGYFLSILANERITCEGADFSPDSVNETNARLNGNPYFGGAAQILGIPTHLASGQYDVIFCIETIEHLLDDELAPAFRELHRLLKSGGYVVVTTPNEERLNKSKVVCPECGAMFHRMQHVRAWTVPSITEFHRSIGFEAVSCFATYLDRSRFWSFVVTLGKRLRGDSLPHLVYVGKKQ